MSNLLRRFRGPLLTPFLAFVLVFPFPASAQIDQNINNAVWRMLYGVSNTQFYLNGDPAQGLNKAWLNADSDGDGLTNGAELAAGTNPFKPNSALAVTSITGTATTVSLTFPTVAGKLYIAQSTATLTPTNWQFLVPAVQVIGDGTSKTLVAPKSAGAFFRVLVEDNDTSGGHVSDWAKQILGYNLVTTMTNGVVNDDTAITAGLANQNVVTVVATDPETTEPLNATTPPSDLGVITFQRGGFLSFSAITVPISVSGTAVAGVDYVALPSSITFQPGVNSVSVKITPIYNPAALSGRTVTVTAQAGGGYTLGTPSSASVAIFPPASPNGTGLTGQYYIGGNATYSSSSNFSTLVTTRLDQTVDFIWPANGVPPGTAITGTTYTVRWTGQVLPQYSEVYTFVPKTDDGVKLWVNGQLVVDKWVSQSATENLGSIALQAGVLYDIKMEYFQGGGSAEAHLQWYCDDQSKQVIPQNRLFPTISGTSPAAGNPPAGPPNITSPTTADYITGSGPFSYTITASNSSNIATTYTATGLPAWLTLVNGVLSGTPPPGNADYQIILTATNSQGTGSTVLDIHVINTGSLVTREIWKNLPGSGISNIPLTTTPTTDTLAAIQDNTSTYAANTGERLRGYFTVPTTGNYYFWLASSNVAELWISNDNEPANKVRRAYVTAPGTASQEWNNAGQTSTTSDGRTISSQQSAWLSLTAGQPYYFEVLHNTGASSSNNLAVGWLLDPTGTSTPIANGTGVIPPYALSQFDFPVTIAVPGSLFSTDFQAVTGVPSAATGSAFLRLNQAQTQAIVHFAYTGLTSGAISRRIYSAPSGSTLVDIDALDKFHPELKTADGGYTWNLGSSDVAAIQFGNAYFGVQTVNYPSGEISGTFGAVTGSQTPPPLPTVPSWTDDSNTDAGASRFLCQATYGPSPSDIATVKSGGYAAWINNQFGLPITHLLPYVQANLNSDPTNAYPNTLMFNGWWKNAITAPDQLRQRVAFGLSEIMVISDVGALNNNGLVEASYYDTLLNYAFGNFRDLLKQVTLAPGMGIYLDMRGNAKGSAATGLHPNENYARETMQLFSIGLYRLWPDGSYVLDSNGDAVATYTQPSVSGMARVFTGWNYWQALQGNGRLPTGFSPAADYIDPMVLVPTKHELGTKQLLDNVVLPAAIGYNPIGSPAPGSQADPAVVDFDTYCSQDLEKALDNIFYNQNVGPFICRELIQRLVTSNPSSSYLYRVVQAFNDDGSPQHVRGNMQAVLKAILLDAEARSTASQTTTFGKQREPVLRLTGPARAFPPTGLTGTYSQMATNATPQQITITTATANRLNNGDVVFVDFTSGLTPPYPNNLPTTQGYTISNVNAGANSFTINATGVVAGTYSQTAGSNTLTVTASGFLANAQVYLKFITGTGTDDKYTITSATGTTFTVNMPDQIARSGNLLIPRFTGGYVVSNNTGVAAPNDKLITVSTAGNDNLNVGDNVYLAFQANGTAVDGAYAVNSIVDVDHFTVTTTGIVNQTQNNTVIYPLVAPPLTRSGNLASPENTWNVGSTNGDLAQTPLSSGSVFNFFSPSYQYPGALAAAGVTTPEFQLTTDSNVVSMTNSLSQMLLTSGNPNGLNSFRNSGGAIFLDLSPYMTTAYTSDANIPTLITALNNLLMGGTMAANVQSAIQGYVANTTNFPYTTPTPTATQMRDRVRAVVHLMITSSEYAIQR